MRFLIVLAVCVTVISGAPKLTTKDVSQRITGGSYTTINQYPAMALILLGFNLVTFTQDCGSSILNSRSLLTAAHCLQGFAPTNFRFRVGSSWANSGGVVHNVDFFFFHPNYTPFGRYDSDIAIIRSMTPITFNNVVAVASIAGPNYNTGDNAVVWTAGWGAQWHGGFLSEQLRHVQLWTVNQNVCAQLFTNIGITANMLCASGLDVGGVGPCMRDAGGPLYHNGVVVGVISFGGFCGDPNLPTVYGRVSSFTPWIQANA